MKGIYVALVLGVTGAPILARAQEAPRATARSGGAEPTGEVAGLSTLPLMPFPLTGRVTDTVAVVLSGDGGWVAIDKAFAGVLLDRGIPVVGFDSRAYFRVRRSPDEMSLDLARVMSSYTTAWHASHVILIGYSHGAEALPFMVAGLPPALRKEVVLVGLLGLEQSMDPVYHVGALFGRHTGDAIPTRPAVEQLRGLRLVCVYGQDETDTLCPQLPADLAVVVVRPGGHHFDGNYTEIMQLVLDQVGQGP